MFTDDSCWYLEGYVGEDRALRRVPVREQRAVCVGRRGSLELSIADPTVSALHAEIYWRDGVLYVRDLGSSNGTYVNRVRISGETPLQEGDSLHFCRNEFRVGRTCGANAAQGAERTTRTAVRATALPGQLTGGREMQELLREQNVRCVYQPICRLDGAPGDTPQAFEMLGRGSHLRLPSAPVELFRIAESIGAAERLSAMFRDVGIRLARHIPGDPNLFFNTHPAEVGKPTMLAGLARLRRACPDLVLTIEIHESVAAGGCDMADLRARLRDLDIGLAYDDFGAGQGRLVLLAETPPDYLKFDISLIRGIDQASTSRQRLLRGLVQSVRESGIRCIAEGVETTGELDTVRDMGFEFAQGYHLGLPAPLECWLHGDTRPLATPGAAPEHHPHAAERGETAAVPSELLLNSL